MDTRFWVENLTAPSLFVKKKLQTPQEFIFKSTNESTIIIDMCIILIHVSTPNVSSSGSLLNYVSTIAALVKINKIIYNIKIVQRDKTVTVTRSLYGGRTYSLCVGVVVPARYALA